MQPLELTRRLKHAAGQLGFTLTGACPAVRPSAGTAHLLDWLDAGYAGQMSYIAKRLKAYSDPRHVLQGARSMLVMGLPYRTRTPVPAEAGQGQVARYAWGSADYHDLVRPRLHRLADLARRWHSGVRARGVVDTAPILEREFARLAGLGWIGKNTMLINRDSGSWFLLAVLLLDCPLQYDSPSLTGYCGTCTACLDACPTGALVRPFVLDATRCISYLTIELQGGIPERLRAGVGSWVFGCDVCQTVCPWNGRSERLERWPDPGGEATSGSADRSPSDPFHPSPEMNPMSLPGLFQLDDAGFRERFRKTPLWRSRRRGLLRNAAIVLGNTGGHESLGALRLGQADADPMVRESCDWAIRQIEDRSPKPA